MKVAFLIQDFSRGAGSERVTSLIANGLARRGHEACIISLSGDNTSFYPLDAGVTLRTLVPGGGLDNKKYFLKAYARLSRLLRQIRPDVVVNVFAALGIYTIPNARRIGYRSVSWEHFNYKAQVGMNPLGRKLAARHADQIVTLTETDKAYYLEDNPDMRAGICSIFNPSPYQGEAASHAEARPWVVSVGRLTEQKGFDRLLRAWALVERDARSAGWELQIVGEGEEREALAALADELGLERVHLAGERKDVDAIYRQASIYASTARFEGLPMTMIEAQSFGLPIVSLDYDTGPRDIVTDGVDGVIVEQDAGEEAAVARFAEALLRRMDSPEETAAMGAAALESSRRFESERLVDQWEALLSRLVG